MCFMATLRIQKIRFQIYDNKHKVMTIQVYAFYQMKSLHGFPSGLVNYNVGSQVKRKSEYQI